MIDCAYLKEVMSSQELDYSEDLADWLDLYARLLVEWNEKINLTAITDPAGIVLKHFMDSLLLTKAVEIPQNASLIDIGTGAGFPSVPVRLYRPDIRLVLLDSLNKRINFLSTLTQELGIQAECRHGRAEEVGREPE